MNPSYMVFSYIIQSKSGRCKSFAPPRGYAFLYYFLYSAAGFSSPMDQVASKPSTVTAVMVS